LHGGGHSILGIAVAYLEKVTDIDNKGITLRFNSDPFSIFATHLEASNLILNEHCETPCIFVPGHPQGEIWHGTFWVVVHANEIGIIRLPKLVKVGCR
jgi:hypothetical protein